MMEARKKLDHSWNTIQVIGKTMIELETGQEKLKEKWERLETENATLNK